MEVTRDSKPKRGPEHASPKVKSGSFISKNVMPPLLPILGVSGGSRATVAELATTALGSVVLITPRTWSCPFAWDSPGMGEEESDE